MDFWRLDTPSKKEHIVIFLMKFSVRDKLTYIDSAIFNEGFTEKFGHYILIYFLFYTIYFEGGA